MRQVADRLQVEVALLHLGGVRFPVTGPARYSMTARHAVELCTLVRPQTVIPIHYEGWTHCQESRDEIEREFGRAPATFRRLVRWAPLGEPLDLGV